MPDDDATTDAGRRWVAALPPGMRKQQALLGRLLDLCVATTSVRSLSVGCSLGRGAGDALSDVDAALGVDTVQGAPGAAEVLRVEDVVASALSAGDSLIGVLRDRTGPPDRFIRRVFAQLSDGVQLDLAVMAETEVRRGAAAPDFVSLYRSAAPEHADAGPGGPEVAGFPDAHTVTSEAIYTWAFLGWVALGDASKYLHRRSAWEAHQRLHEARDRVWMLWAAATGALYPWHGLSQVLDQDPRLLPPGIEATVAGLDHAGLLEAARATADILTPVSTQAAVLHGAALPTELAAYTTDRLRAPH